MRVDRRRLLAGASTLILAGTVGAVPAIAAPAQVGNAIRVRPVPLGAVRLKPSIFSEAAKANRDYLAALDPQRLLHNFYRSAGLDAPAPRYGGWEAMGIAGHSLGHWLSAVSMAVANTGNCELAGQLDFALSEMARIQNAHGDGYCGGTTVERGGETVDGKIVFEEIRAGTITSNGFDLNGGWVPLYTWHKIHAGLLDAHTLARNPRAMPILLGLAGYLAGVLEPLDDAQMQQVLAAEHGGLNESYAETYALTGNPRWLRMAQKIHHRAVLDPLAAGEDGLEGLHANTQIPKVIGLARLHEITGDENAARAARFFHSVVTSDHSYAIGGNSDREHFGPPGLISGALTDATCEACNTYNMLKLTRHLYQWQPDAALFDFYERAQLNHIMAHQDPASGRFVYFMPLAAGARRTFSDPEDSFWCCVGSGMESHAKHADSIFWASDDTLYVNLYIPAELDWKERGMAATLESPMPFAGRVSLAISRFPRGRRAIALRLPAWAQDPAISVNGERVTPTVANGYAIIERKWKIGDRIDLDLPMALRREPAPDDAAVASYAYGPLVYAADLGTADEPFGGVAPVLLESATLSPVPTGSETSFATVDALGTALTLRPFFGQYRRRSATYFRHYATAGWERERPAYLATQRAAQDLARRTTDVFYLGEMQPERDHSFTPGRSEVVNWNGRPARRLFAGSTMEMTLARPTGPAVLRLVVFEGDARRPFAVAVDGEPLGAAWPEAKGDGRFRNLDFALPPSRKNAARIAISATGTEALVYEARMLTQTGTAS